MGFDPFSIAAGVLDITAARAPNPLGLPFVSGQINTGASFSQLYGYFEMRAELPAGAGLWPAFWLLPASNSTPPELDVMEQYGANPAAIFSTSHSKTGGVSSATGFGVAVPDTSQGFHSYGVLWGPAQIVWYFDGVEIGRIATPADMNTPMYMLADLAIAGQIDATTALPAHLKIDFIHAYAYSAAADTGAPPAPDPLPPATVPLALTAPGTAVDVATQAVHITGVTLSEPDAQPGETFTVTLVAVSGGVAVDNIAGLQTLYANSAGRHALTLTGDLATINQGLASLRYYGAATGVAASTADTITLSASDPLANTSQASIAVTVTKAPNVPPSLAAPSAVQVVSTSATAIAGLKITDSDAYSANKIFTVTFHDSTGLLRTPLRSDVVATGEGTTTLVLSGGLTGMNTALTTLTYRMAAGAPATGADAITVTVDDGQGGSAIQTIAIGLGVPANQPPVLIAPVSREMTAGQATGIAGITLSDSDALGAGETLTATLSAGSGFLAAGGQTGRSITLTGDLPTLQTHLAGLTYTGAETGARPLLWDPLTIAVADGRGGVATTMIALTIDAAPGERIVSFGPAATRAMGGGNVAFIFTAGQIADPKTQQGLTEHILNFASATSLGAHDFLTFEGFGAGAQLVFDHLAAPGGAANPLMQYYRVVDGASVSPIFLVQMAAGNTAHLGAADYAFLPR